MQKEAGAEIKVFWGLNLAFRGCGAGVLMPAQ